MEIVAGLCQIFFVVSRTEVSQKRHKSLHHYANSLLFNTSVDPLLVRQQLISLLDDGLIYFENGTDNLRWDMQKIQESNTVSSSLTSTTVYKFKTLQVDTQTALKICACIGSTIDLEMLGIIIRDICQDDDIHYNVDTATKSVAKDCILPAIQEGLLTESCDGAAVSFIHDSVQSAAYSLLRADEQTAYHLRIGLILNTQVNAKTPTDYIFTVANQLARGRAHVQEKQRIEVAKIFFRAGDICKCSCAFREAHFFYEQAIRVS
jgi:predicted ATPase